MSISFESILSKINLRNIIKIPLSSSEKLPSRGMVMIQGTINGFSFKAPSEPDGKGSHWFEISEKLRNEVGIMVGQTVSINIESIEDWVEPEIPEDIMDAIIKTGLMNQWNAITTKARWEWLRWIRSTQNPETRTKRIDVACSKLQNGDKRPCCFDSTRCSIPEVSSSGVLFE
ncbi:MAG: YdeI/OmpD-associated family protein [Mobilitalea sp.]